MAVCPEGEELVIEIGPGKGALTEKLLERTGRVIAIEVDPLMVDELRRRFAGETRLEIIQADILKTDLDQWGPVPMAGNLPYYITSPILEKTLRARTPRAVFLIQKEVAERITAAPGTRDYGFMTVQTALFGDARRLFDVKPGAFRPPPRVDSTVILVEARDRDLGIADREAFLAFLGQCFRQKRKTLRNNLTGTYGSQVDSWPEAGMRAEQLPLEKFAELFRRL
jgi:16S rRNA (adenine1518-N6/adenine1519-N6)-dimethyltransferase